jgi:hypothetical protein
LEGKDNQKGPVGDSLAGRVYGFRFVVYVYVTIGSTPNGLLLRRTLQRSVQHSKGWQQNRLLALVLSIY